MDERQQQVEMYCEDCLARGQSVRTVEGKYGRLRRFLRWWCERSGPLDRATLRDYQGHLWRDTRLDIATQRNHLTALRLLVRYLHRRGYLAGDAGADLELPKVPRRLTQEWLTAAEFGRLADHHHGDGLEALRDRTLLELLYATGLRRMELAALNLADIDHASQTLTVRRGKGGHGRRIPVSARALRWLRLYLEQARPQLLGGAVDEALFLSDRGVRFEGRRLGDRVGRLLRAAGLKKRGACKLFRHGIATAMLENGADLRHVQEMLGHADISTTQVYAHVTITELKRVYARTHPGAGRRRRRFT